MKDKMNKYQILAGIILFGSVWGLMECTLGGVKLGGALANFPMGALLGGLIGLGLMAYTRRTYNVLGMQIGMALVAGLLRYWAPVGTCVICSALAIAAEGLVFELIFNRPVFSLTRRDSPIMSTKTLALVGVIAGFTIYVTGYMFTQVFTPLLTTGAFNFSNFGAVMPLIIGRGFFAAILGGVALPVAVTAKQLHLNIADLKKEHYYGIASGVSIFCWLAMFAIFYM